MALYDSLLERLDGRPYSNYFACLCPFHNDTSPSFFVYEDDGRFFCRSCRKSGTIKYLDNFLGSTFKLTRSQVGKPQVLPKWRKWEQEHGSLEGIANHAHKMLLKFPQFQSYFKNRKIHEYITKGWCGYLDGYAIFPVLSGSGQIVDLVTRSVRSRSSGRYTVAPFVGNGNHPLYCPNWENVKKSEVVYVVFGIIDAISLELLGLPVVTGITGKSLSPDLLKPLGKKFIIIPDDGEEREAYLLANKLGWRARVKALHWDDGCKDVDDERVKFGNQHLLQLIGA